MEGSLNMANRIYRITIICITVIIQIRLNLFGPLGKPKDFVELENSLIEFAEKSFSKVRVFNK